MEEKKFYQEIRDNLAAFSSTNYQFSVIPFKIDENTIVFPINKINMISGIGESYFPSLKKKELTVNSRLLFRNKKGKLTMSVSLF